MKYQQRIKFQTIDLLEKAILNCKQYNAVWLGVNLRELRDLRRDLYSSLTKYALRNEEVMQDLFDEYNRYCQFIANLLANKKLSNAVFAEILHTFLGDYDFIDSLDSNKSAYQLTLKTIDSLKTAFKSNDDKMSTYHLRDVNKFLKFFIESNGTQDEPSQ